MLTTVPGGREMLLNIAPPGGTTRGRWPGVPGLILDSVGGNFLRSGNWL
jgi:hypothetical protein